MTETRKLRVFLCHSSQDKPFVRELYQRLYAEGWIDPWLDEENLLPGQEWATEIAQTVRDVDVVIVCVSKKSLTKEGYVQKEISYALDIADEKPEGTIYIVPVLLEECQVPGRLRRWQWLDYTREKSYDKLLLSLRYRADRLYPQATLFEKLNSIPPIIAVMTTYVFGDDLFDESYGAFSLSGEMLGVFGVAISDTFGKDDPKRVIAFEVWITENEEKIELAKVFMSTRAYYDPIIRKRLEQKGELILIEPKQQILLETVSLQLLVTIADFEYDKNIIESSTCFERITFELRVWPKLNIQ